jgi:hypothetical protein
MTDTRFGPPGSREAEDYWGSSIGAVMSSGDFRIL